MTRAQVVQAMLDRYRDRLEAANAISTGEAAELLKVSESTVKRWADVGKLKFVRAGKGYRHIDIAEGLPELQPLRRDQ